MPNDFFHACAAPPRNSAAELLIGEILKNFVVCVQLLHNLCLYLYCLCPSSSCIIFVCICIFCLQLLHILCCSQCPTGRVFQYRIGSGRVLDKIPGSGTGSGRVGVSKYMIGYFQVSFLLSGIPGYVGYFRVFPGVSGICGYFRVYMGI